jgi:hypothetical protein
MRNDGMPDDPQEKAAEALPADEVRPWEQLEPGRFMPRRIRGSYRGGKLG